MGRSEILSRCEPLRRACVNFEKHSGRATHGRAAATTAGSGSGSDQGDEKELQGQYSNLVMIHHNLEEFTMNFIYIFPNGAQGKLTGSMIVSPGHAKRIWRALGENIARYESQFGSIKESPAGSEPTPTVGFVQ